MIISGNNLERLKMIISGNNWEQLKNDNQGEQLLATFFSQAGLPPNWWQLAKDNQTKVIWIVFCTFFFKPFALICLIPQVPDEISMFIKMEVNDISGERFMLGSTFSVIRRDVPKSKFLTFHPPTEQELDGTNSINGGEGNFGASGRDRLNLTTNPVHI